MQSEASQPEAHQDHVLSNNTEIDENDRMQNSQQTAGDAVGQINSKGNVAFGKQSSSQTGQFNVLLDINGTLLPRFADATVRHLGLGTYAGLCVTADIQMGAYHEAQITIRFKIRHLNDTEVFTTMIIPLAHLVLVPEVTDFSTTDQQHLAALLTHIPNQPLGLLRDKVMIDNMTGSLNQDGPEGSSSAHPVNDIPKASPTVTRARFEIDTTRVRIIHSRSFADDWTVPSNDSYSGSKKKIEPISVDAVAIATEVREILALEGVVAISLWFKSDEKFAKNWQPRLLKVDKFLQPYAEILQYCRKGSADDLSIKYLCLDDLKPPAQSVPATSVFLSKEQRTVSLIVGVAEEQKMLNDNVDKLQDTMLEAVAIRDPSSLWLPQAYDLNEYGIQADGQCQLHYFVVSTEKISDLLPKEGDKCEFYVKLPVIMRPMPHIHLNPDQSMELARELTNLFDLAEDKAIDAYNEKQDQLESAQAKEKDDLAARLAEELETLHNHHWVIRAASIIRQFLRTPLPDLPPAYQGEDAEVCFMASACTIARRLRRQEDEDYVEWVRRVSAWITENGPPCDAVEPPSPGAAWPAYRMHTPAGSNAAIALFAVKTPVQDSWTMSFEKPPMKYDMEGIAVDPIGSLSSFLKDVFTSNHPKVTCAISYELNHTTSNIEGDAIYALNNMSGALPVTRLWEWSRDLHDDPDFINFHEEFPALATAAEDASLDSDTRAGLKALTKVPHGLATINGYSVGGKTRFGALVMKHAVSQPRGKSTAPAKDNASSEAIKPRARPSTDEQGVIPEGLARRKTTNFSPQPSGATAKGVWLAPQNKLVGDAALSLSEACPDKVVCRAFPLRRELANLLLLEPKAPHLIDISASPTASFAVKEMASVYNDQRLEEWLEVDPGHCPNSLSEYAKRLANSNPDMYWKYIDEMEKQAQDSIFAPRKRKEYMILAKELLRDAIASCDIICSTPAAIGEMQDMMVRNKTPFVPDLIVLDAAGRVTEASSAIVLSRFPHANFLFVGDTRQLGPMAIANDNRSFKDFFGLQRKTSLFGRIESVGKITFTFRKRLSCSWSSCPEALATPNPQRFRTSDNRGDDNGFDLADDDSFDQDDGMDSDTGVEHLW